MISELGSRCSILFMNPDTKNPESCYGTLTYSGTNTAFCNICGTVRHLNGDIGTQLKEKEKNEAGGG